MTVLSQPASSGKHTEKPLLYETLLVLALTVIPALLWPQTKGVLAFLPITYVLIERRLRKRAWAALGFNVQGFTHALKRNWLWVLLVVGVSQPVSMLVARAWLPEFIAHVKTRVPLMDGASLIVFLLVLPIAVLGEELAYRALFQQRLSWFVGTPIAVVAVSVLFGLMHWAPGNVAVVVSDVALVMVDSVLYGVIFARGKNLWAAWLAHWLADVVGVILRLFV
jgi:membrane protease YdiL (CAAX protease family)